MFELIKQNPKTSITITISILALIFTLWRIRIARRTLKMNSSEFKAKERNFSIYLEDRFRAIINTGENAKYLLFHVRITNFSNSKNSFIPSLEIKYHDATGKKNIAKIKHQPELFKKIQQELTELDSNIRTDEREIKSGWLIYNFPSSLEDKRIDSYKVLITDSAENKAEVTSTIIKDIEYGN